MKGLPAGWKYTPSTPPAICHECGHREAATAGTLRSPDGREWPLVGNSGPRQEQEMVKAIVGATGGEEG